MFIIFRNNSYEYVKLDDLGFHSGKIIHYLGEIYRNNIYIAKGTFEYGYYKSFHYFFKPSVEKMLYLYSSNFSLVEYNAFIFNNLNYRDNYICL